VSTVYLISKVTASESACKQGQQSQGHRVLANKMKEVAQAALMKHGSGGLNGFDPPNPPDPQSI
jgi:hypothetical protein